MNLICLFFQNHPYSGVEFSGQMWNWATLEWYDINESSLRPNSLNSANTKAHVWATCRHVLQTSFILMHCVCSWGLISQTKLSLGVFAFVPGERLPWGQRLAELCDFFGKIRVSGAVGCMWVEGSLLGVGVGYWQGNLLTGPRETFLSYVVAVEKLIPAVNHDIIHPHS